MEVNPGDEENVKLFIKQELNKMFNPDETSRILHFL
jgi:hypothetical protein